MANAKPIYTVFTCDEWCSRASMRLIMCTTSSRRLKSFITKKIEDGTFGYEGYKANMAYRNAPAAFKRDFNNESQHIINNRLQGGYVDYCYDGEEI